MNKTSRQLRETGPPGDSSAIPHIPLVSPTFRSDGVCQPVLRTSHFAVDPTVYLCRLDLGQCRQLKRMPRHNEWKWNIASSRQLPASIEQSRQFGPTKGEIKLARRRWGRARQAYIGSLMRDKATRFTCSIYMFQDKSRPRPIDAL